MRDPHVVLLTYGVQIPETASFDNSPPREGAIDSFSFQLQDGTLEIEPSQHFADITMARAAIEPLLRSWEIDIALRFGNPELSFRYKSAHVVDRNPIPGELEPLQIQSCGMVITSGEITLKVHRAQYPDPPSIFRTTPDVETLWHRYLGYRQGHEPLPAMAYFCLTFLETLAGGRSKAADLFKISPKVLKRLGQLSSERGDPTTARKYSAIKSGTPLSGPEVAWIDKAIQVIIRRVGEFREIDSMPTITLDDLPTL
jgi:hypothetical protein